MKNVKIFLVFLLVVVIVLAVSKYFNCGFVRDYSVNTDSRLKQAQEKIAELEKNKVKDTKTIESIANWYSTLGTIYMDKRLWDLAIENYMKGLQHGKDTPGVYYSIGLAYANRGSERDNSEDIDKAEFYYKKAIEMQDNYYDAQNALAILLFYHKGEKDKAISTIQEVVARNKKNYIARFTLGRFYYETGQLPKSLSVYEDLSSDLDKLPPSEIIEGYKKNCKENIQRIMSEINKQKKG
jgi:tetratricopeptide (TPR) repeat protein